MKTFNSLSLVWCCSMILDHVFCFYFIDMLRTFLVIFTQQNTEIEQLTSFGYY